MTYGQLLIAILLLAFVSGLWKVFRALNHPDQRTETTLAQIEVRARDNYLAEKEAAWNGNDAEGNIPRKAAGESDPGNSRETAAQPVYVEQKPIRSLTESKSNLSEAEYYQKMEELREMRSHYGHYSDDHLAINTLLNELDAWHDGKLQAMVDGRLEQYNRDNPPSTAIERTRSFMGEFGRQQIERS